MERVRISEYPDYTYTVCKNPKLCGAARVFLLLIHGATGVQPSILVGGIDAPTFEITFSSKYAYRYIILALHEAFEANEKYCIFLKLLRVEPEFSSGI